MSEKVAKFIVWHLIPRRLVYWCAIRVAAHATTGQWGNEEVTSLTFTDALRRWPREFSR
jgi:hypothetical protein